MILHINKEKRKSMDKFMMKKSAKANIYKSIRFPIEINDKITDIINEANAG